MEGQVRITLNTFCCCSQSKWFILYIDDQDFYLFKDKQKSITHLKMPLKTILGVQKRQLIKSDINKFSIYYQRNPLTNEVTELKLEAINKREFIDWVYKIRLLIDHNKFTFQIKKNQFHCDTYLSGLFQKSKNLYISINIIEFIIKRQLSLKLLKGLSVFQKKQQGDNTSEANSSDALNHLGMTHASTLCFN